MSLLSRLALSQGDPARRAAAVAALAALNQSKVAHWHRQLRLELELKQLQRPLVSRLVQVRRSNRAR
jgi:hypothetical protein